MDGGWWVGLWCVCVASLTPSPIDPQGPTRIQRLILFARASVVGSLGRRPATSFILFPVVPPGCSMSQGKAHSGCAGLDRETRSVKHPLLDPPTCLAYQPCLSFCPPARLPACFPAPAFVFVHLPARFVFFVLLCFSWLCLADCLSGWLRGSLIRVYSFQG